MYFHVDLPLASRYLYITSIIDNIGTIVFSGRQTTLPLAKTITVVYLSCAYASDMGPFRENNYLKILNR